MKKLTVLLLTAAVFAVSAYDNAGQALKAAYEFRKKRQNKEAAAAFDEAFTLARKDYEKFQACFYGGVTYAGLKDYANAVNKLKASLKYTKNNGQLAASQYHVAFYLGVQGKYDEALAEMKRVKMLAKGATNYYTEMSSVTVGRYLLQQKKYKEAIETAKEATANKRADVSVAAWVLIYDASTILKDFAGAEEAVKAMLAKENLSGTELFSSRRIASSFYLQQKKYDLAAKYAAELAENAKLSAGQRVYGTYYLAFAYQNMGKKEQAVEQWKKLETCGISYFQNIAKRNLKNAVSAKGK